MFSCTYAPQQKEKTNPDQQKPEQKSNVLNPRESFREEYSRF